MPLDTYTLRRRLEELRYSLKDGVIFSLRSALSDPDMRRRLKIGLLAAFSTILLLTVVYRSIPEPTSIILTPAQQFLVDAGAALAQDAGEDEYRFAGVGMFHVDEGAAVRVVGSVRSEADLQHVRQRLEALDPAVQVDWDLSVQGR